MTDTTRDFFEALAKILLRCWILGFALLFIWIIVLLLIGDLVRDLHGSMFGVTSEQLDVIFYCGMGLLKLFVLAAFLIPWLAIKLVLKAK